MLKEGHVGLSLILFSPFMYLFRVLGVDMSNVLITCVLMAGLSSVPDLDLQWGIKHRGITHTFLFGCGVGILFSFLLGYAFGLWGWFMGFVAGFGGTASHLLGDAFTYSPFRPLYPFSDIEVAYGFFNASNKTANSTFLGLGLVTFILSYEPSIVTQILNSIN